MTWHELQIVECVSSLRERWETACNPGEHVEPSPCSSLIIASEARALAAQSGWACNDTQEVWLCPYCHATAWVNGILGDGTDEVGEIMGAVRLPDGYDYSDAKNIFVDDFDWFEEP